ncbi:MAG: Hsp70 family protein [Tepidisphaerales bacterium]
MGIDLGTTFSAAAWVDESGQTAMIRNAEGDVLTPSVVFFNEEEVVVGKEARTATLVHPDWVAEWVKRDMGLPYYSRPVHGQRLPPEVIQACILRKLKADIVRTLGEVDRVVITVPAYFDEPRRKGTADAGEMAGLKVLDIVNEPTAAALAFGETLGYLTPGASPKNELTLLVYDLGGGTFDATLLRLGPGNIQTIATDGDVQLGGHDWDMRLVEHVANRFKRLQKMDPRKDPVMMNRILAAVIDAKHALSARARTNVRIELAGEVVEVPVSREQFEEMTSDLLERTAYTTRQLLAAANMEWKDISRLLLVGGATRMPMVVDMLRKLSGLEPDHTVHPDEAVARGAALYAAYLLGKESGEAAHAQVAITNVNSHSLGVEGIDPETLRKRNVTLIPRNTPLPAKVTERFVTKSVGQQSIAIQVLEGESSLPGECTAIGRTVIRDLPEDLPKNWPVDVTFEYAANGRLTVEAIVPGTHQSAVLELERAVGMSHDGIARWKQPVGAAAGFNEFDSMVQQALQLSALAAAERMSQSAAALPEPHAARAAEAPHGQGWTPFAASPAEHQPEAQARAVAETEPSESAFPAELLGAMPLGLDRRPGLSTQPADDGPVPPWLLRIIGHVVAALVGLSVGYFILHWWRPMDYPLPW